MYKIRYEISTGKVNLITNSMEEIPVSGHQYMTVETRPEYDDTSQHLYVKNNQIIAVDLPKEDIE